MRTWKGAMVAIALLLAYGWPALAEADGNHIHIGELHFDPIVGGAIAVFVGFITLMFVGQWVRFNAARRRAAATLASQESPEKGEEAANDNGQEDDGQQPRVESHGGTTAERS